MNKLKLIAVGSSPFIAEEIREIMESILGRDCVAACAVTKSITEAEPGAIYICANTQAAYLEKIIPATELFKLELHPTTLFFMELARIPDGAVVHVFNNLRPYISMLIKEFQALSDKPLIFKPIAYEEMPEAEVTALLQEAKYIIGVDRFMGENALLKYKELLRPDVCLIAGRRTASIGSSCQLLRGLADHYLRWVEQSDAAPGEVAEMGLTLDRIISLLRSATVRVLMNQIGSNSSNKEKPEADSEDKLLTRARLREQVDILHYLTEKVGRAAGDKL